MTTDVNTAFAETKTSQLDAARAARARALQQAAEVDRQIAAGELVALGGNRFRITQGWDAGEVVTINRDAMGQIAEVVAEHGLDVAADGTVALYSAVPAWHGLGQIIPGGISDIDEVLRLGGIGFEVTKRAVRYSFQGEGEDAPTLRTAPGHFVTVREDTGAALGVVGARYEVFQQRQIFEFLQDLVGERVVWESAGALRGGRRVFVSMRVPESIVVDSGGIDDRIDLFIAAMNSHDARSQAETVLTPWRPVCKNTERFALRDAVARWGIRHTSGALDRLDEARRTLGLTLKYAEEFAAEETALARTAIVLDDMRELIDGLWPVEDATTTRTQGYADRRRDTLMSMYEGETERLGRTAYAAERTITDYLDHIAPRRPGKTMTEEIARATALLEGTDDDIKTTAHRRLMLLTRR